MKGHDEKPKRGPNDAFRRVVWAKGMFFIYVNLFYSYLQPPTTSQHHPVPHNHQHYLTPPQTATSPRHRAAAESTGRVKQNRVARLPFFCFGYVSLPLTPFYPTEHMYGYSYMCSTDFFFWFSRFTERAYDYSYTRSGNQKNPKKLKIISRTHVQLFVRVFGGVEMGEGEKTYLKQKKGSLRYPFCFPGPTTRMVV